MASLYKYMGKHFKCDNFNSKVWIKIPLPRNIQVRSILHANMNSLPWMASQSLKHYLFTIYFYLVCNCFISRANSRHLSLSINPLHFVYRAQCSGMPILRYLDSYVIVGVYGALTIGCVRYAILWYNVHAQNVLPWWSHVTVVSGAIYRPARRQPPRPVRVLTLASS